MLVSFSKAELCNLLDVTIDGLKYITKNNLLEKRIEETGLGYTYKSKYKDGRNVIYELEYNNPSEWIQFQKHYKIRKKDEHTCYTNVRLNEGLNMSRSKIIRDNEIDISGKTAKRYDDILINEKAIKQIDIKIKCYIDNTYKNCVYRWLDKYGNIIYIGKAQDLKQRIVGHFSCSKDKLHEKWFDEWGKIEYIEFEEYGDCSLAEEYFIMKYKPLGNISFKDKNVSFKISQFENLKWKEYVNINTINIEEYPVYDKGKKYYEFVKMLNK